MYPIEVDLTPAQAKKLAKGVPVQLKAEQVKGGRHSIIVDEETAKKHRRAKMNHKGMRIHLRNPSLVDASITHGKGFGSLLRGVAKKAVRHAVHHGKEFLKQQVKQHLPVAQQMIHDKISQHAPASAQQMLHQHVSNLGSQAQEHIDGMGFGRTLRKGFKKVGHALAPIAKEVGHYALPILKQAGEQALTTALSGAMMGGMGMKKRRGCGIGLGRMGGARARGAIGRRGGGLGRDIKKARKYIGGSLFPAGTYGSGMDNWC